jgi:RHS repeat-associated protein
VRWAGWFRRNGYDQNGNQTSRKVSGITYTLVYDAENRLVQIKRGSNVQATYTYDGDGNRVKTVVGSTTTTYIGNYLEWSGSTTTMKKYYYASGQRIAMRQGSTLYFLLTDHLGSTAVTATSGGGWYGELRYYPWGGTRYDTGTTPTSYRYTGQRQAEVGLYYYGARYYDPQVGRFVSPDSIIPNPGDPVSFDRFAYVRNNPLKYVDPSGHLYYCGWQGSQTDPEDCASPWQEYEGYYPESYSILNWAEDQSNESDIYRSSLVLEWICTSGGWWGPGCPGAVDLVTWLLNQEAGILLNDQIFKDKDTHAAEAAEYVVAYLLYLFPDDKHITPDRLAEMTAFFNPNGGGTFSLSDWSELMTAPPISAFNTVQAFQHSSILASYYSTGVVVEWWVPWEDPRTKNPTVTVTNVQEEEIFYIYVHAPIQ